MKRRASPNRQTAGVSLFPFLAVLLCTMGALIVVLVVIARHAQVQVAEAARRGESAAAQSELAIQRGELEWRISELKNSRQATQKLLSQKQLELSHLEEHARRLRDQLEESAATREHFSELAAGDARQNEELKARLDRLQRDADRTKTDIDKLRRRSGGGGESYAIIPYHGPNETRRRPIYIECRKGMILLQPEGIALTEQDFLVDLGPSNPLVSALRAARDYHLRNQLAGKGEAGTPYPLFIIRPDGIEMSLHARTAIASWGSEFGYELVAQDWSFEFSPSDPTLALAMRQAVSEGRIRQAYLARAAPRLSHTGSHATFRASPRGGLVQVEGSSGGSGGHRGQTRPARMAGRRFGGGGHVGGGSGGLASLPAPDAGINGPVHSVDGEDNPYVSALGTGSVPGGPLAGGRGLGDGSTGTMPGGGRHLATQGGASGNGNGPWSGGTGGADARRGPTGSRLSAGGGQGFQGGNDALGESTPGNFLAMGGGTGKYALGGSRNSPGRGGSTGAGRPASRPGGSGTNPLPGGQPGGNSEIQSAATSNGGKLPPAGNSPTGSPPAKAAAYRGRPGAAASPSPTAATGSGTSDATGADATGAPLPSGPNLAASPNGIAAATVVAPGNSGSEALPDGKSASGPGGQAELAGRSSDAAANAQQPAGTARGASGRGGDSPERNGAAGQRTALGARGAGASGSASSGQQSSNQQSSSLGGGASSASQSPQAGGLPSPNLNFGQQNAQSLPQSVAKQRGEKNWANPDASTTNVPIERPIFVVCDAEHLTLLPEGRGKQGMRVIPLRSRTAESVDDLVTSVWDRIDSWGTAGRGMYWRPALIMEVEPGGQRRYAELQSLLVDSGLDVHGRPRRKKFGAPRR